MTDICDVLWKAYQRAFAVYERDLTPETARVADEALAAWHKARREGGSDA